MPDDTMQQSLGNQILNGLGWQYINVFSIAFLQLVVLAIMARLLTPKDYGLIGLAMIVMGLGGLLSQMGVGPAIVQFAGLTQAHVRSGFTLSVSFGCLMTMVVWLSAPLVARIFNDDGVTEVLRWLSLSFFISSLGTVAEALYIRRLMFSKLMWVDVGSYLLGYMFIGIPLALLGCGLWSLVAAMLGQSVAKSLLLLVLNRHRTKPLFSSSHIRELLHFGGGITLATIMNYIANQGDYFVVGKTLGAEPLGIYSRAYQLMLLPAIYIGQSIQKVTFPTLSKLQNDRERLARVYFTSAAVLVLVCIPLTVLIVMTAPEIVGVLLGPKWSGVIGPFRILGLGILFRTAYKLDHSITSALGAVYKRSAVDAIYAVLVITASFIGIHWGITGVATGVLFAITLNYLLSVSLSLSLMQRSWIEILQFYGPGIVLGLVSLLIAMPVRLMLLEVELPTVIVLILTVLLSTVGVLALLFLKPNVLGDHGMLAVRTLLDTLPVRFVPTLIRKWAQDNLS